MNANRPLRSILLVAALPAVLGLNGCLENDGSSSRHRADDYLYDDRPARRDDAYRRNDGPPPDRRGEWYDDRRYDDDRNYERDRRSRDQRANANVPRGVQEVAIARGYVGWTARRDGRVWITDSEHDAVIWNGRVYDGERVEVVPKRNRIFVDRREIARAEMKDNIRYRIWFDRERR